MKWSKFDNLLMRSIAVGFFLLFVVCLVWAALLLALQLLGWLRFDEWQGLPLSALFISEAGQAGSMLYVSAVQPLGLIPAWGSANSGPELAALTAGKLLGLSRLLAWVLEVPLTLSLVAVSLLSLAVSNRVDAESTALLDLSGDRSRSK